MLSLIPPAGVSALVADPSAPFPERLHVYGSGTCALGAALEALANSATRGRCEVIVPAYGCPALVSAILYAKLVPVLADLGASSAFVSKDEWARCTTDRTLAVVPVNFLGIAPPKVEPMLGPSSTFRPSVIYDCCQGWPALSRCPEWAIATIVSFGRGKPVSLGGGGGVLVGREWERDLALPSPRRADPVRLFPFRAWLNDQASHPRIYWWVDKLPFLGLGRTEYHPLSELGSMPHPLGKYLAASIGAYLEGDGWTSGRVNALIDGGTLGEFQLLPDLRDAPGHTRLLRLPLLASSADMRDAAISELRKRGYGATALYRRPLWDVKGLEFLDKYAKLCPNAHLFADRLLTLPIHRRVSETHLLEMVECLANI